MKTPEQVYNETEHRLEIQMSMMDCFFTPYDVIYAAMKDYAKLYYEAKKSELMFDGVDDFVYQKGYEAKFDSRRARLKAIKHFIRLKKQFKQ